MKYLIQDLTQTNLLKQNFHFFYSNCSNICVKRTKIYFFILLFLISNFSICDFNYKNTPNTQKKHKMNIHDIFLNNKKQKKNIQRGEFLELVLNFCFLCVLFLFKFFFFRREGIEINEDLLFCFVLICLFINTFLFFFVRKRCSL